MNEHSDIGAFMAGQGSNARSIAYSDNGVAPTIKGDSLRAEHGSVRRVPSQICGGGKMEEHGIRACHP